MTAWKIHAHTIWEGQVRSDSCWHRFALGAAFWPPIHSNSRSVVLLQRLWMLLPTSNHKAMLWIPYITYMSALCDIVGIILNGKCIPLTKICCETKWKWTDTCTHTQTYITMRVNKHDFLCRCPKFHYLICTRCRVWQNQWVSSYLHIWNREVTESKIKPLSSETMQRSIQLFSLEETEQPSRKDTAALICYDMN